MDITFNQLNILQKFLTNRVDYDLFQNAFSTYYVEGYIEELFDIFRKNPVAFITDRAETEFFDYIIDQIENTNYKG